MKLTDILKKTKTIVRNLKDTVAEVSREQPFEEKLEIVPAPAERETSNVVVSISGAAVARATLIILGLLALAYSVTIISDILIVFFVAFLLAAAMEPTIDALSKRKIPRGVAVISFYIITIFILGFIISYMVPILAQQISELASHVGVYLDNVAKGRTTLPLPASIQPYVDQFFNSVDIHDVGNQLQSSLKDVSQQLFAIGGNIWEVIKIISNGFINTVLVLVLAYFMVVERHAVDNFIFAFFPIRQQEYVATKIALVQRKIGFWLRGMLILMVAVGLLVFIGLAILGVKYAAVLALIAGLLEIVPVVGPLLSWLVAIPIVLNQSAWGIVSVTILYVIVQQLEGHILVPMVMRRFVGLNPIVILFALLVGYRFLGVLGAVLSVPVATMVTIFLDDFFIRPKSSKAVKASEKKSAE